ncbi:MAG: peptide transporter permease [Bacillales bacterium]|jgi:oligopeptide transport system permease protein|nr:peptide transporter permease [Bacillales bacterium]
MENRKISPEMFRVVGATASDAEKISRPSLTFWHDAWIRLKKNKGAIVGLIITIILILLAIFAPMLSPYKYSDQDLRHANLPPKVPGLEKISWLPFTGYSAEKVDTRGIKTPARDMYVTENMRTGEKTEYKKYHYFGTDDLGRDLWTRVWTGARVSLSIAVIAAIIDFLIGVTYGGISGFFGGKIDIILQRIVEVIYGIPYLIVVILFRIAFEKAGIVTLALAMTVTGWIGMSRLVRGQILKLKNQEFVMAAQTLGASNMSIIFKHLIPNTLGPIIISIMFTIPAAIFAEAFLSFIGLGISPPLASLGSLVNDGIKSLTFTPYKLVFPATVISVMILSFNLIADGLRDALDPKMRK